MTNEEIKLIDVLIKHGNPTNVCIIDPILTFNLLDPIDGCNSQSVLQILKDVITAFPEYKWTSKMVNDETHFWVVLTTNKS